jgi:hypothetical protein
MGISKPAMRLVPGWLGNPHSEIRTSHSIDGR